MGIGMVEINNAMVKKCFMAHWHGKDTLRIAAAKFGDTSHRNGEAECC